MSNFFVYMENVSVLKSSHGRMFLLPRKVNKRRGI